MNPSANERTGLNLPPPVSEQLVPAAGSNEAQPAAAESAPMAAEADPTNTQPAVPALPAMPVPSLPLASNDASVNDVSNTTQNAAASVADDSDLIEKEWVNKAKQIVERTRDDPFQQSKELTVFKADYMKKRYNKTMKLSE